MMRDRGTNVIEHDQMFAGFIRLRTPIVETFG